MPSISTKQLYSLCSLMPWPHCRRWFLPFASGRNVNWRQTAAGTQFTVTLYLEVLMHPCILFWRVQDICRYIWVQDKAVDTITKSKNNMRWKQHADRQKSITCNTLEASESRDAICLPGRKFLPCRRQILSDRRQCGHGITGSNWLQPPFLLCSNLIIIAHRFLGMCVTSPLLVKR